MRRRVFAVAAVTALALAACAGAGDGAGGRSGRFVVERVTKGSGKLLDGPARATYCPSESLLTVVAVGRVWSGGLALRVALPLRASATFQVGRALGSSGSATAAFRPAGGVARFGVSGTVTLVPSSAIEGGLEVSVTDSSGPNAQFRGRLSNIAYTSQTGPPCGP